MKVPSKNTTSKNAAGKAPGGKVARKVAAKQAGKAAPKKAVVKNSVLGQTAPAVVPPAVPVLPPGGPGDSAVLDRLFTVITARRDADPTFSHSARLLSRGMPKVAQKFGEEAVECLIEAVAGNRLALVGESADVLYHLMVMWVAAGVEPVEIWTELARREGVSGVAEKAARALPVAGTKKIP